MNRRSFLGLIPMLSVAAAFPRKLLAAIRPRYLERMTDIRCSWTNEEIQSESYRIKLFVDRDRDRLGVYTNWGKTAFVWELPLSDVEVLMKKTVQLAAIGKFVIETEMVSRYENFTERHVEHFKTEIRIDGEKFVVMFFGHDLNQNAECEINKKDVDYLLTVTRP